MIFEHLPGLQVDAFLITHGHYRIPSLFLHIPLPLHLHYFLSMVFHVSERPDWVCFGDAHSPFLLSRGHQIHTAEPLILSTLLVRLKGWLICGQPSVADKYRDIRERRQESRRRLLSIGSMTRWHGTDARPLLRRFEAPRSYVSVVVSRPKAGSSCISPA